MEHNHMIYLTEEEWSKYFLPKLIDNKLFFKELKQIKFASNILLRLIHELFIKSTKHQYKLKQNLLYNSLIYYQKYILYYDISYEELTLIENEIICSSCLLIAFKSLDKRFNINFYSQNIQSGLNKLNKIFNIKYKFEVKELVDKILEKEFDILFSIGFNLDIDSPFIFLHLFKSYLLKIKIGNNTIDDIINKINDYMFDSILFPLFLYYTSYEIAIGCILSLKKKENYNFINLSELIKLTKIDIDIDNIHQCGLYISKIIDEKDKQNPKKEENIKDNNSSIQSQNDNFQDNLNFHIISAIEINSNDI